MNGKDGRGGKRGGLRGGRGNYQNHRGGGGSNVYQNVGSSNHNQGCYPSFRIQNIVWNKIKVYDDPEISVNRSWIVIKNKDFSTFVAFEIAHV